MSRRIKNFLEKGGECKSCPQYLPQIQRKTILLVLIWMIHCSTLQVLISSILVMVLPLCPLPLSLTKPTISPGLILSVWPSSPNTKWHSSLAQSWSLQSNNLFTLVGRDATLSSLPVFFMNLEKFLTSKFRFSLSKFSKGSLLLASQCEVLVFKANSFFFLSTPSSSFSLPFTFQLMNYQCRVPIYLE